MSNFFSLAGKVAVVTGGGQGIGEAICRRLAGAGAKVGVFDMNADSANRVATDIGGVALVGDLTKEADLDRVFAEVVQKAGPVDVLVNNAGVPIGMSTSLRTFDQLSQSDFERQLNLNLHAVTGLAHLVLPAMRERKFGRIVIISSESWRIGLRFGLSNYAAAKAAALGFMRHLAHEVGRDGITANAVSLGTMNNYGYEDRGSAVGRTGTPEDVGAAVAFLASREAAWMTGQTLALNGGALTA